MDKWETARAMPRSGGCREKNWSTVNKNVKKYQTHWGSRYWLMTDWIKAQSKWGS